MLAIIISAFCSYIGWRDLVLCKKNKGPSRIWNGAEYLVCVGFLSLSAVFFSASFLVRARRRSTPLVVWDPKQHLRNTRRGGFDPRGGETSSSTTANVASVQVCPSLPPQSSLSLSLCLCVCVFRLSLGVCLCFVCVTFCPVRLQLNGCNRSIEKLFRHTV